MISFPGYEDTIQRVCDNNQDHVFQYWEELGDPERRSLLEELSTVDFDLLSRLYNRKESLSESDFSPAPYINIPENEAERKEREQAREAGTEHIRSGNTAAFVVAGGQGSRLGFDGPKGKFPVGAVSNKTLFQIHTEKIVKYSEKYGTSIPLLIMTSEANHDETVAYFRENGNFGLPDEDVIPFKQNMIPSLDEKGKLILQSRSNIFRNPDGHGGSLTALRTSGALEELKKRGITTISYFQVDNPLVKIIDPVFIGFHTLRGAEISSKALKKAYPGEKVGVFVKFDSGRIGVVEYSDLPDEKAEQTDEKGNLVYSAGSIAIHLFDRDFVETITSGGDLELPFHTARKKIAVFRPGGPEGIQGFKFEKFVFDALPLTDKNVIIETLREEEFAPVKNPSGVDSVESARELMVNLHRKWLKERGIPVPEKAVVEISPIRAVEPEDLDRNMRIENSEKVYIE